MLLLIFLLVLTVMLNVNVTVDAIVGVNGSVKC